jgi:chemotaxis family two-component system sensor kinase Cph1
LEAAVVTPDNCDRELVHVPGCIQAYGIIVVLRTSDFTILQVSDNCKDLLGLSPLDLLGRRVLEVVRAENVILLQTALAENCLENNPRYVFSFVPVGSAGDAPQWDVSAHLSDGLLILEMEPTEVFLGEQSPNFLSRIKSATVQMERAATLREFCQIATEVVAKFTGLDRVMVYRFADDESGWVFAETKRDDLEPYLDLHYPAVDIPRPAREIYKKIWLRPLPDAHAKSVAISPLTNPDSGKPLDMTYCFLRGASSMYTDYLRNMRVRMSLTMAIRREGRLWGLIACHHYETKIVSCHTRSAYEVLAQIVSLELKASEDREHREYQDRLQVGFDALLARALPEDAEFSTFITERPNLLDFISAGGAALHRSGKSWALGCVPSELQRQELIAWLRERSTSNASEGNLLSTNALGKLYPPADVYKNVASGLLAVPVSRSGQDWLLWFRPEVAQSVKWAGDPNDKPVVQGEHGARLMPRTSFELWKVTVRGQSESWQSVEIDGARRLRLAILDIVIGHAERLALLNRQLEESNLELDSFAYVASHDLREPLRGIHHYAQYLLDTCADRVDAEAQTKLHSLLRLAKRMDTLINSLLHYSRVGRLELSLVDVDLNASLAETFDLLAISRQEVSMEFSIPRPLPTIRCDAVRIRELLVNLISNAIKYNQQLIRRVEVGYRENGANIEFYVTDNGIGVPAKFHDQIFKMFNRLHGRDEFGGGNGAGLTICRKIVERHGGRIWVESEAGSGSTFYFTLNAGGAT